MFLTISRMAPLVNSTRKNVKAIIRPLPTFKYRNTNHFAYRYKFLSEGEPENYTWNAIRSESDELMFPHASNSAANIFDGVKVTSIQFSSPENPSRTPPRVAGEHPISAFYECRLDGKRGRSCSITSLMLVAVPEYYTPSI